MIESRPMQALDRLKLALLTVFHLLWGSVLWFSISKLGLGLSTDSVHLLFAASNLAAGRGLLSFDGSPVVAWPPLHPALLAALHLLTGLSTFAAAHVLQALAFASLSVSISLLFLRLFPDDFPLALAGVILSSIGGVVVAAFGMLGSDYVHLALALACTLLTVLYIERPSGRLYVLVFVTGMLAMLQRYLGVAVIATAAVSILLWLDASLPQRLLRGLFLGLAALPSALWLALSAPLLARRAPVSFAQNFEWFSQSVLQWFLAPEAIAAHPVFYLALLWIAVALIGLALWVGRKRLAAAARPLLLFGLLYTAVLFGSAAIAYYNRLEGRFLLPLYVPAMAGMLLALRLGLGALRERLPTRYAAGRVACFAAVGMAALLLLRLSLPAVLASQRGLAGPGDNAFNTLEWAQNKPLAFWRNHPPSGSYLLLSNQPDAVAFHTGHACEASPRRTAGPYGQVEFPVESYASIFAEGRPVYLIWIKADDRDYYYRPEDLEPIAELKTLYSADEGAVYRLRPRSP